MSAEAPIVFVVDDDRSVRDSLRRLITKYSRPRRHSSVLPGGMLRVVSSSTCVSRGGAGLTSSEISPIQTQRLPIIFLTGHGDIPMFGP
jgi:FixJ family two-component response regulator